MKDLADKLCALIGKGRPVAVATILSREGSAPRTAGSKMVIEESGRFFGTIGGGKFEADVLAAAKAALEKMQPRRMFFDLTHDDADAMDMICGGTMNVLVDVATPDPEAAAVFEAWRRAISESRAACLVTAMRKDAYEALETQRCLVFADQGVVGGQGIPEALVAQLAGLAEKGGPARLIDAENAQFLVEPTIAPVTLAIFGAGHVSMPTARLAAEVGFRVVVADDREAFANRERFAGADRVLVLKDFETALSGMAVDAKTYVVIVTRGHRHDRTVLAQALRTDAGYIGMIGSRRKRDAIYASLREDGFGDADFDRVHCPIGLSIGAETPAEIAVSIVAELIACRAGAAS